MKKEVPNLYLGAAKYYDYDNRDNLTADIPFYLEYAQKTGTDVLELGCGTGRVAIPLAKAGFNITGIDLSDSMLKVFKTKLDKEPEMVRDRIRYIKGDMSYFYLDKTFDLIIVPFRAFQALTEENDINGCLKCVREHLNDNGLFIINVFRPNKEVMDESWCYPEKVQWETIDEDKGLKITKKHWGERIDAAKQIIYPCFAYEATDAAGNNTERIVEKLSLKYYYYLQLKEYLTRNGLEVVEEFGWYNKRSIQNGRELIFVCRKAV